MISDDDFDLNAWDKKQQAKLLQDPVIQWLSSQGHLDVNNVDRFNITAVLNSSFEMGSYFYKTNTGRSSLPFAECNFSDTAYTGYFTAGLAKYLNNAMLSFDQLKTIMTDIVFINTAGGYRPGYSKYDQFTSHLDNPTVQKYLDNGKLTLTTLMEYSSKTHCFVAELEKPDVQACIDALEDPAPDQAILNIIRESIKAEQKARTVTPSKPQGTCSSTAQPVISTNAIMEPLALAATSAHKV